MLQVGQMLLIKNLSNACDLLNDPGKFLLCLFRILCKFLKTTLA
ncbi:Uncharacterised protein [Klebsiella aerogenes]|nr:Uncharacterised protein [Klebsiella aerogenes]